MIYIYIYNIRISYICTYVAFIYEITHLYVCVYIYIYTYTDTIILSDGGVHAALLHGLQPRRRATRGGQYCCDYHHHHHHSGKDIGAPTKGGFLNNR